MFPNNWCISFKEKYISCWSFQIINLQLKCQFAKEQELNRSSSLFHKVTLNFLKVRLNLLKDQLQFSISPNTKLFWKREIWWIVIQLPFPPNPPFLSQSLLQNSVVRPAITYGEELYVGKVWSGWNLKIQGFLILFSKLLRWFFCGPII